MNTGTSTKVRGVFLRACFVIVAWVLGASAFAGEQITYFHNDVLGSPIAATDQKGYVMWKATYEPYGERIQSSTDAIVAMDNTRWYGSHVQDDETGLLYMQARYEDPQLGRFLSIDPASVAGDRPGTFNRYAYGANNPYRYVDPDGRDFWEWLDKFTNPFSNSVPSFESFQSGTRQLMGNPRNDDPTREVVIDYTARQFQTVAQATAKVGDYWYNASLMAADVGEVAAVARVSQGVRAGTALYRAVSLAEHADIVATGAMRAGPNSFESGKWFAESAEHARQWGTAFEGAGNFKVIEAIFPRSMADKFFRNPLLDNIGPARFGTFEEMGQPIISTLPTP